MCQSMPAAMPAEIRFVYPFHRVEFDSANWGHLEYSALPTRAEVDRSLLAILWFSCRVASGRRNPMSPRDWKSLRSYRWYGPDDLRSFGHRSRAASMGCTQADYTGKPVIAILNTWSDINPCHSHLRERANDVKRGVWQAGGFPVEMPAFTLGETFQKPTTMMYRNLLAMEAEEMLRSYPADGCVLLGGCDKTTPALLMGAISMNLPAIYVPAGPMLRGNWHGEIFGSGSDVSKYWAERRAGIKLELDRFDQFSKKTPLLANLRPSGKYLMEDFYYAGGLPALLKALGPRLDLTCRTITGKTLGENISDAEI